jgi:hypothetical protein
VGLLDKLVADHERQSRLDPLKLWKVQERSASQ